MQFFQVSLSVLVVVALQATSSIACSTPRPPIKDANTVTFNFYDSNENLVQTTSLGVLDTCHNANAPFHTFNMAVGQNMFNRNIHFFKWSGRDCTGSSSVDQLTNANVCWVASIGQASSYKIAVQN